MAKKKRKKGRKKNPGRMLITNKGKGKRKKRRNPAAFGKNLVKNLVREAKEGVQVLGGRYVGEVGGEVGARYLGDTIGDFAPAAAQVGLWFALGRFLKGSLGRLMRLGLLSETIHQAAVLNLGLDVPSQVMNLLPAAAPIPAGPPEEEAGASGVGLLEKDMLGQYDDEYDL